MLSRRSFLKVIGGTAAVAVVAPALILPKPRTIISPDATLFLPPPGGWLPQQIDALASSGGAPAYFDPVVQRSITVNGRFTMPLLWTLWTNDADGAQRQMGQMITPAGETSNVSFIASRSARGLYLTAARLPTIEEVRVTSAPHAPSLVRDFEFRDDWAGDFVRNGVVL